MRKIISVLVTASVTQAVLLPLEFQGKLSQANSCAVEEEEEEVTLYRDGSGIVCTETNFTNGGIKGGQQQCQWGSFVTCDGDL